MLEEIPGVVVGKHQDQHQNQDLSLGQVPESVLIGLGVLSVGNTTILLANAPTLSQMRNQTDTILTVNLFANSGTL